MKRIYTLWIIGMLLFAQLAFAAWREGEMLVQVKVASRQDILQLQKEKFVIDQVQGKKFSILVIPSELDKLRSMGYQPEILIEDMEEYSQKLLLSPELAVYHDYYSTLALVDSLLLAYPNLVYKQVYGQSIQGKELYAVKISDNAQIDENEPEISFDGCHHGDETTGSEVIILLMRELCVQYGTDPQITDLVNNREIWIYPFINPDGRQSLTRYNAAGVDVNRDWGYMWDAWGGSTAPFSQPESQAARDWINDHQFVISQTNHSGTEAISYPWSYRPDQCPDRTPIDFLAAGYSSTSGYASLAYFQGYNGMYAINGSAKDSYYGLMGSVGWTMEVSLIKNPPPSTIPMYYNYNRPAMLYLIEMASRGVKGLVTDANTGAPVPAIIWVSDATKDYWPIYTDPEVGDFHKFLLPGTYNLFITANGYQSTTFNNIAVSDTGATPVDVQLQPQLGTYAYRVIYSQIPNNNYADEGYTPSALRAPDNINYSIGRNGYVVLDMGESILDFPGNDLRIIEGDATPEGYTVKIGQEWNGPWHSLGIGSGTQEFDISATGLQEFRYVRIEDDGDGSATVANAGFDLDAVEGRLIPSSGPFVMAMDYIVHDSLTNNNGILEAGEVTNINLTLQNLGVDPAQNVRVTISSGDPLITVLEDSAWYGNLAAGEQGIVGPYLISIDETSPNNSRLNLNINITADGGNSWTHPLQLTVVTGARISSNPLEINFDDAFVNFTAERQLTLDNSGTDTLQIHHFSTDSSYFWVEENSLSIAPGAQQTIIVKFLPLDTISYVDTLVISNSDPISFVYTLPLSGRGILAPDIQVTPDSVVTQLLPTDSVILPVSINNVGSGELSFTTQIGNFPPNGVSNEGAGGSDSFGHIWIDSDEPGGPQYNWVELNSGLGIEIPLSGLNSTSNSISLGFDVPFYEYSYSSLRVCNNGWISFSTFSVSYNNTQLPSILAPRTMIAPLWDNLNMQTESHIYYLRENDRFIIQWDRVYTATGFGPYTFQLIIYDDGNLILQYNELQNLEDAYTVGMQNSDASDGFHIAFNQPYLHNQMAILISRRSWVSINPVGGTVPPGGNTILNLKFKTDDFPFGHFWASLEIHSNDPDEETVTIPLHLIVDSVITSISAADLLPSSYKLEQNYPNPFNPKTTIQYQIPEAGMVKIEIFNTQGQKIRTLVNAFHQPGYYKIFWDAHNEQGISVSTGLYFYKFRVENFIEVKRMLLLK